MNAPGQSEDPVRAAFGLDGQHALVTGGNSGLGLAIARCFLRAAGARVTITGTDEAKLKSACADLRQDVQGYAFDEQGSTRLKRLRRVSKPNVATLSILVNNAGRTLKKPIDDMTPAEFQSVLDIHVTGAFALSRAFLPQIEKQRGSILYTGLDELLPGHPQRDGLFGRQGRSCWDDPGPWPPACAMWIR